MAKSKKNGQSKWNYVDEKGKFVSKNYKGKTYIRKNGSLEFIGNSVPKARESRGKNQYIEKIKSKDKPFSEGGNRTVIVKNLPNILDKQKPIKERSTDDHFEFSYTAQKKWGLDRNQQIEIWKLFKEANRIGSEFKELTDSVYNAHFSYNLESAESFTKLYNRIEAAKKVVSGEYFESIANKYKKDFKEGFSNIMDKSTMIIRTQSGYTEVSKETYEKELMKKYPNLSKREIKEKMNEGEEVGNIKNIVDTVFEDIDKLSDEEFFQLLRKTNNEALAYALDSIITTFGYEAIIDELLYVGNLARELK